MSRVCRPRAAVAPAKAPHSAIAPRGPSWLELRAAGGAGSLGLSASRGEGAERGAPVTGRHGFSSLAGLCLRELASFESRIGAAAIAAAHARTREGGGRLTESDESAGSAATARPTPAAS